MTSFSETQKGDGQQRDFGTGSVRDGREGKGRYDLLEPYAIKRLAQHFENGAKRYGDNNWKLGQPLSVYLDSGIRHGFNLLEGKTDEDHAAAMAWNAMAFISTKKWIDEGKLPAELDDIDWDSHPVAEPEELEPGILKTQKQFDDLPIGTTILWDGNPNVRLTKTGNDEYTNRWGSSAAGELGLHVEGYDGKFWHAQSLTSTP